MKIVILPGLDGTGTLLSEIVELLTPNHEVSVVRYDPDLYSYQDLKTKAQAALPADDYIIVAESFSGPLAVMLASKNPTGLQGVVFVATFASTPIKVPKFLTYLVDIAPIRSHLMSRSVILNVTACFWPQRATWLWACSIVRPVSITSERTCC